MEVGAPASGIEVALGANALTPRHKDLEAGIWARGSFPPAALLVYLVWAGTASWGACANGPDLISVELAFLAFDTRSHSDSMRHSGDGRTALSNGAIFHVTIGEPFFQTPAVPPSSGRF
jgi:hypothetical protein